LAPRLLFLNYSPPFQVSTLGRKKRAEQMLKAMTCDSGIAKKVHKPKLGKATKGDFS
jgi:hypothetical protein